LKPISAHIVIGTNLFSDFLGGLTDVFGGRSNTYKKKLTTLYNESIQELQERAFELGANSIIALNIDMDEISGGGKNMFMITATGTAVIIENAKKEIEKNSKSIENISLESVIILKNKKEIIEKAIKGVIVYDDETWSFIIENKVEELFPFLISKWKQIKYDANSFNHFSLKMFYYLSSLSDELKYKLVYEQLISEKDDIIIPAISTLIKDLRLVDYNIILEYLNSENFHVKKRILTALIYDKSFYNSQDLETINKISDVIKLSFPEKGKRSIKKGGLLTSKEKEIWICDCGHQNNLEEFCSCGNDIYGFKKNEVHFERTLHSLNLKSTLIKECLCN
jgi:uncharacterized protein YbjQ (UPF0145 family)